MVKPLHALGTQAICIPAGKNQWILWISYFLIHNEIHSQLRSRQKSKLEVGKGLRLIQCVWPPYSYQWKTVCLQRLSYRKGQRLSLTAVLKGMGSTPKPSSSRREHSSWAFWGLWAPAPAGCSVIGIKWLLGRLKASAIAQAISYLVICSFPE